MSIAGANAILAEVEPLRGDLFQVVLVCHCSLW